MSMLFDSQPCEYLQRAQKASCQAFRLEMDQENFELRWKLDTGVYLFDIPVAQDSLRYCGMAVQEVSGKQI